MRKEHKPIIMYLVKKICTATLVILTCLCARPVLAQDGIQEKFLFRTYHIRYGDKTGSGFMIKNKEAYYLVTAKHIVESSPALDLFIGNTQGWLKLDAVRYTHPNKAIDIAVFKIAQKGEPPVAPIISDHSIAIGSRGYFLGYPYGMRVKPNNKDFNDGFPLPLVKQAGLAAINVIDGAVTYILDGMNNVGFSGGPVVFLNQKTQQMEIVGVISNFLAENAAIKSPYGDLIYQTNSGIITAYGTKHVQEIIDAIK